MHLRREHAVHDLPTLHTFIRAHPLGVLTTSLPSATFPTLQCSHIPWVLDTDTTGPDSTSENESGLNEPSSSSTATTHNPSSCPLGVLRGHIARANPQAAAMIEAVTDTPSASVKGQYDSLGSADQVQDQDQDKGRDSGYYLPGEVLIIFTSPVDHYITPHFYTAAKAAAAAAAATTGGSGASGGTGKARIAPTWNYAAVQVYGRMRVYHDSSAEETGLFLQRQLSDLAKLGEEGVMGFTEDEPNTDGEGQGNSTGSGGGTTPWKLDDAPEKYIAILKKNIVGMQVDITRVEGRFKVSQERPVGDRDGVVDGLEGRGGGVARRMAEFVRDGRVV
ncbi:uncharacterized protein N7496_012719 [Penicillium cataractarum]|uniref:FMN-binding split barrel n=1 Tax=Penicillium cataractarum TaxID=2100454 RepID=A0A9W9R8B8_9EURO|nr:uncharacterized protein N7496_012719 [Penicillium cataractarum]KAJ5355507.1 hypothetical protein N7496_012719 [Penicillium cataractarum]